MGYLLSLAAMRKSFVQYEKMGFFMRSFWLVVSMFLICNGSFAGEWTNPHYPNKAIMAGGYAKNALEYKANLEAEIKKSTDAAKRKKAMAEISHAFMTYCKSEKVTCPKDEGKVYEFQTNMCSIALDGARKSIANILKGVRAPAMVVQTLHLKNEGCVVGEASKRTGGLKLIKTRPASGADMLKKAEEVKPKNK